MSLIVDHILESGEQTSEMEQGHHCRFPWVNPLQSIAPSKASQSFRIVHWVAALCLNPGLQIPYFNFAEWSLLGSIIITGKIWSVYAHVVFFGQ